MTGIEVILAAICINATCNLANQIPINDTNTTVIDGISVKENAHQNNKLMQFKKLKDSINGQNLIIATFEDFPLSYTTIENNIRIGKGVCFEIVNFLSEKFNFTYEVIVPEKNILGSTQDLDGSLFETMNKKKADLAAAFIPLIADARKYIYYSTTTLDEGEWIMIMLRPTESATGSGLLAPFEKEVWILILVSLLAVGPIIYVLIIIRMKLTGDQMQPAYNLSHCAWFVYGALMKQGSTLSPIADSTRLLFATWWIFITILTSFYTANLTAFLTLSKFTLPINNVGDIIRKEKHFVAQRGGGIEYAIKNNEESLNILNRMILKNRVIFTDNRNDTETLITLVEKKNYVFVRDRPAIDHVIYTDYQYRKRINREDEKVHCPFAVAKDPIMRRKRAFAYPHGSQWSALFDPELLYLVESGIIKYMMMQNLPNAEICPQDLGGTERQLRNGDLLMTYYIMIAGFATATVVFFTEVIFRCVNSRKAPASLQATAKQQNAGKFESNQFFYVETITPPPPYTSIFSRGQNILAGISGINGNKKIPTPQQTGTKKIINGRDYVVFKGSDGENKLVPIRAPSATLFQYLYTD